MIIPITCFTCNFKLASKYELYKKYRSEGLPLKEVFKKLRVRRMCCKTILLTHVDILEKLN